MVDLLIFDWHKSSLASRFFEASFNNQKMCWNNQEHYLANTKSFYSHEECFKHLPLVWMDGALESHWHVSFGLFEDEMGSVETIYS